MTREENLIVVAAEECNELAKELMKAMRFGPDGCHPDEPDITNSERILIEYTQLRAVMDMLIINRAIKPIPKEWENQIYRDKVSTVEHWEQYSKEIGTVN